MKILVQTTAKKPLYTISNLYIDGVFECNVLEDTVRDLNNDGDLDDAGETKVYGETAIPAGTYKVVLSYSNRFKRVLPEILGVKGFEGIRIHGGNDRNDTHGCLLVGKNNVVGKVTDSQNTLNRLFGKLDDAVMEKEAITIEIIRY
jgi:hypothetical protein